MSIQWQADMGQLFYCLGGGQWGIGFVNTSNEMLGKGKVEVSAKCLANPVGGEQAMVSVATW
jgi:hypothetical protein